MVFGKGRKQTEEWFRRTRWNYSIAAEFEARLKRSRTSFHRAQYLRIQGLTLLDAKDDGSRKAGEQLLRRVIAEYPDERFEVIASHEHLGTYFKDNGRAEEAERELREVLHLYKVNGTRSCTSGFADLTLAELLLDGPDRSREAEIADLLLSSREEMNSMVPMYSHRFRWCRAMARLYERLRNFRDAAEFANRALELAATTKPQFSRHPTVGFAKATPAMLEELRRIAKLSD